MEISVIHLIIFFILGLMVGSFLNVVIYRFPKKLSLISPPSSCPACGHRLTVADLIPLFSYIFLRGKCRHCGAKFSPRYFLVELMTGVFFVAVPWFIGPGLEAVSVLFLLCLLLVISFIDLDHGLIPNRLLAVGLGTGIVLKLADSLRGTWEGWGDAGLGMLIGGGIMLLIFAVSRGGMGGGDFKLMIVIGFFTGFYGVILVLMAGFLLGGIFSVAMLLVRRLGRKDPVPLGPFLALAVVIEVFWGEQIWDWYLGLSGMQ